MNHVRPLWLNGLTVLCLLPFSSFARGSNGLHQTQPLAISCQFVAPAELSVAVKNNSDRSIFVWRYGRDMGLYFSLRKGTAAPFIPQRTENGSGGLHNLRPGETDTTKVDLKQRRFELAAASTYTLNVRWGNKEMGGEAIALEGLQLTADENMRISTNWTPILIWSGALVCVAYIGFQVFFAKGS